MFKKILVVSGLSLLLTNIVFAAAADDAWKALQDLTHNLYTYVVAIGILIAAPLTIYAGFLLASGDPEKIKSGWEWLTHLVQGLLVLALAATLFKFIGQDVLLIG